MASAWSFKNIVLITIFMGFIYLHLKEYTLYVKINLC